VLLNASGPFVCHSWAPAEEAKALHSATTAASMLAFENINMRIPSVGRDATTVAPRR
jgi:hypothetical protein